MCRDHLWLSTTTLCLCDGLQRLLLSALLGVGSRGGQPGSTLLITVGMDRLYGIIRVRMRERYAREGESNAHGVLSSSTSGKSERSVTKEASMIALNSWLLIPRSV